MSMADGAHRKVEVDGPATYSSSPELSSPPKSPESPSAAALGTATHPHADLHSGNSTIQVKIGGGGVEKIASATTTTTTAGHTLAKNNNSIHTTTAAPKRVRKKKDPNAVANGSHSTTATESKEPKIKKPRTQPGTSTVRKRQKTEPSSTSTKATASGASRQSRLTDLVGSSPNSQSTITLGVPPRFASPQNGNLDAIPKTSLAFVAAGQPTPSSRSSGQNYDPIRSTTTEAPSVAHNPFSAPPVSPTPKITTANRASASPSIASLIDHPPTTTKPAPPVPFPHHARHSSSNVATPTPAPPSPPKVSISPSVVQAQQAAPPVIAESPPQNFPDQPMQLNAERDCLPPKPATKKIVAGASTGPSSSAVSPKPARRKDAPRSLPPGNGLLSSALFGGPSDFSTTGTDETAPTVILHIPMNGETNKYINFARLAEERYGFHALHPRLAAQRERLARIAAAGAALEKGSGSGSADEMSVDLSEGESNVEMGGMEGGSAMEGKKPVKKKPKADQYDKDDPFVDDSELLWEEQAAASKDGFFVYSGPLVPEGEKPTIERADGTVKRGRGRGRAATARGTATNRGGTAAGANTAARGAAATRKPRVTKAARALMEQEKIDREKMAVLAAKPSTYPG